MQFLTAVVLALALMIGSRPSPAEADDATVGTYHGDMARSGHYVVPGLTWARAAGARLDPAFDGRVQGHVYAQPLFWHPPGAAAGTLIVATEDDVVHALNANTGREVWRRTLGPAAAASALPCGDIDPLGITGTPVIDTRSGALYLDAMIDRGSGARHLVFSLSLRDGSLLPGWPIDVAVGLRSKGMNFVPSLQNQRSALALVGDRLYVPFGGHWGDCGDYHGWVVGLNVRQPGVFGAWKTWASKGGIWAFGGTSFDGRYLFAATGNTDGADQWSGGEAVIRLSPDLRWRPEPGNFFTPANWRHLDADDQDLGGSNPLVINLPGRQGRTALLLALGKDGKAYLLDRRNLGGIGRPLAVAQVANGPIITAPAAYREDGSILVAVQARASACPDGTPGAGLLALRIGRDDKHRPSVRTAWCALLDGRGAPIVTTSGHGADPIVWIVGGDGDGLLHGFRADTGQVVFDGGGASSRMAGLRRFTSILPANGRLYVAGDGRVFAFTFGP